MCIVSHASPMHDAFCLLKYLDYNASGEFFKVKYLETVRACCMCSCFLNLHSYRFALFANAPSGALLITFA